MNVCAGVETYPVGNISIGWYVAIMNKPNVSLKAAGSEHSADNLQLPHVCTEGFALFSLVCTFESIHSPFSPGLSLLFFPQAYA